jgi:hypothetical protein
VAARDLVAAVDADQEQRHPVQGAGEGGQKVQGRAVAPVQVVEQDRQRLSLGQRGEGRAQRLEQCGAIALGRCRLIGHRQREGARHEVVQRGINGRARVVGA